MDDDECRLDLLSSLFLLAREMRRQITELMAEDRWAVDPRFRPPCMGVMAVVAKLQPISQRDISDHLGIDASDVVGVLDVLESAQLLERRRDPRDRRRHAVVLTEAGAAAARRFAVLRAEAEDRVLADLEPDERRLLVDLLNRANARAVPGREEGAPERGLPV